MTSGELREKIDSARTMWRDRRAIIAPVMRVSAVLLGAAVVAGYVTAGNGEPVAAEPAPASSLEPATGARPAPASSLEPATGGALRLRDVAIPERLQAPRRSQSSKQDSSKSREQTPAQAEPSQPSRSGGFDSVG